MKTMNELVTGKCVIVATNGHTEKRFNGEYDEKLEILFMCIPSHYEIIGYVQ